MRGQPVNRGPFLRTESYLPHAKEPVTEGPFSGILSCRLKAGFTVLIVYVPGFFPSAAEEQGCIVCVLDLHANIVPS